MSKRSLREIHLSNPSLRPRRVLDLHVFEVSLIEHPHIHTHPRVILFILNPRIDTSTLLAAAKVLGLAITSICIPSFGVVASDFDFLWIVVSPTRAILVADRAVTCEELGTDSMYV